jgi:hypothetical protein
VASATLLVERVSQFWHILVAFIRIMTCTARLGIRVFTFAQRVMTVTARQAIAGDIVMLFVLEYDISGGNFKLQPDGFMGCFGWKRRVAQNPHEQKVNYQTVSQF